jgi:light-harvesting complex I chlorophyll a/b binding protein 1
MAAYLLAHATWCFVGPSAPSLLNKAPSSAASGSIISPASDSSGGQTPSLLTAASALALAAAMARGRKSSAKTKMVRHFFGDSAPAPPPPPPKKAETYKDFVDPWLGSADFGFDPLNLAVSGGIFDTAATAVPETTYYNYRESEVKHGRFAMIAFLAIFAESADRGALLKQLGVAGAQDNLDGTLGLDEVQLPVLVVGIGAQALAEYSLQRKEDDGNFLSVEYNRDRQPGDLGFDPLGLVAGPGADKVATHNLEVNIGRLAMIGVTAFLFKEFVAKDL